MAIALGLAALAIAFAIAALQIAALLVSKIPIAANLVPRKLLGSCFERAAICRTPEDSQLRTVVPRFTLLESSYAF